MLRPRRQSGVIRNGYHPEREILTGIGPVSVKIPKVRSRTGSPVSFRSALVPPYVRKTRTMEAARPWRYLKGISTGEMSEALSILVGPDARGLSPGVIRRLKEQWKGEYLQWKKRRLDRDQWVYLWADGIYSGLRAEPKRRIRWLMKEESKRLLALLPPHQADIAQFSLLTGLRQRNILELGWTQIDLDRRAAWVHPDQAKARKAVGVPLYRGSNRNHSPADRQT
ncbi:MAG: transposase [Leptospirales bacterium]